MREFRSGNDRGVGNFNAVVRFVLFLQTAENGDRVLDRRLVDHHFLEAALKCGILFDILSVFVEGGRADHMKFASREGGLQHIAGIHAPLGLPRTDNGVELIDEENDLALLVRHFLQKLLQALLEFAAVLGARNEARHIERKNGLAAKGIRHFVVDDALREPFDDGRLTDARLADEHGVVLRAALQNLHRAANFVVAADHGVELPFAGARRQIDRVLLQRFTLIFRIGVVRGVAAANGLDGFFHRTAREARVLCKAPGLGTVVRESQQEHFGRNELVARLHRLLFSEVEEVDEVARNLNVAALTGHLRQPVDRFVHVARKALHVDAGTLEQAPARTLIVGEHGCKQMQGFHDLIVMGECKRLSRAERILELSRELVLTHMYEISLWDAPYWDHPEYAIHMGVELKRSRARPPRNAPFLRLVSKRCLTLAQPSGRNL